MKTYNEHNKYEFLEYRKLQNRKDAADGLKAICLFLFFVILIALLK